MLFDALQAVIMRVGDMPRAQAFYRDTLGLPELLAGEIVSVYSTGNSELCLMALTPGETAGSGAGAYPNLRASDAAVARAALLQRGVDCGALNVSGPVTWFSFRDPDGNRLDCCEFSNAAY